MTLFEIDRSIQELIENGFNGECLNAETGEVDTAKAEKFLADLQIDRDVKLDNYGKIIKNMKAEVKALDEEEKRFKARRQALERRIGWFEKAVISSLMISGAKSFTSVNVVFSTRKSQSVEVNEELLDKQYLREKTTYEPDKKTLAQKLKDGEEIPGAWLVTNLNLTVK